MRAALVAAALLAGAWLGLGALLRPSISLARVRTGTVDAGPMTATLSAPGTVVPESERVVSSPIDSRILHVLVQPGAAVKAGAALVELDTTGPALAVERLRKELRLKEAAAERAALALEGTLAALESRVEVAGLTLSTWGANLARNRKLFAEGLVSEELLRQSELDEARTRVELARLKDEMRLARRSAEVERSSLAIELATARSEAAQAERELALSAARSEADGVVTYVATGEGAAVRKGDVLARVADLTAFRVDALVPDVHAARVAPGQEAFVRIDDARLPATVRRVAPEVRDGQVAVSVSLAERAHALLRPSLRVDVEIVTGRRERALRLPRGSFGAAEGGVSVWVLKGDEAVRTTVRLGVSNAERYEVLSGLAEGDEVVLSELADFAHLSRVRVKGRKGKT
ncbi:MAG: efflux RND transporter periplasmic adaptor subunit [Thermoanaerobaculia bacterium]